MTERIGLIKRDQLDEAPKNDENASIHCFCGCGIHVMVSVADIASVG